ncbi:unnamed protein product [Blepharisma stoltei]|uniref:Potassium channel domain-containing protein n=1 Tax=Blepharisma stoltei TaxID=1481888 RepID=A0AAU9JVB2_9CILI|nr:unnamed protein product [Blepharisma stoltei]
MNFFDIFSTSFATAKELFFIPKVSNFYINYFSSNMTDLAENAISRRKINKITRSEQLFDNWSLCEFLSAVFAIAGIVSATLDYEFNYSLDRNHWNCAEGTDDELFRYITTTTTAMSLFFLILRDQKKALWDKYLHEAEASLNVIKRRKPLKKKSTFNIVRILEIIMLLVFPYPFMHAGIPMPFRWQYETLTVCYTLSEIFYVIMFGRFIFLLRALANFAPYEDHLARRYCERNNVKANVRFSFKCILKQHPLYMVAYVIGIPTIFILGSLVRIFERPLIDLSGQDYQNPLNALWLMFTTMATIGYGDFYPISFFGRMICVLGFLLGALIFSTIIVAVDGQITLNNNQSKAFLSILKTTAAAKTIQKGMNYYVSKRKRGPDHPHTIIAYLHLRQQLLAFKRKKEKLTELNTYREQAILDINTSVKNLEQRMNRMYKQMENLAQMIDLPKEA